MRNENKLSGRKVAQVKKCGKRDEWMMYPIIIIII